MPARQGNAVVVDPAAPRPAAQAAPGGRTNGTLYTVDVGIQMIGVKIAVKVVQDAGLRFTLADAASLQPGQPRLAQRHALSTASGLQSRLPPPAETLSSNRKPTAPTSPPTSNTNSTLFLTSPPRPG